MRCFIRTEAQQAFLVTCKGCRIIIMTIKKIKKRVGKVFENCAKCCYLYHIKMKSQQVNQSVPTKSTIRLIVYFILNTDKHNQSMYYCNYYNNLLLLE